LNQRRYPAASRTRRSLQSISNIVDEYRFRFIVSKLRTLLIIAACCSASRACRARSASPRAGTNIVVLSSRCSPEKAKGLFRRARKLGVRISAHEIYVSSFSFPPARSNYLPPTRKRDTRRQGDENAEREREREREREGERPRRKDREEKQIRARAEESVMYEGTVSMRVCSCSREHVAPISARRVSLSLSLSLSPTAALPRSLVCIPSFYLPPPRLLFSQRLPIPLLATPPHSILRQGCTPALRRAHFCTPWRVSKDGEIRFAPRENGVIIYEGGNKKKGINQRGERAGTFASNSAGSEKRPRKLPFPSIPSNPRNRARTQSSESASQACPQHPSDSERERERGERTFRSLRHSGDPLRGHAPHPR